MPSASNNVKFEKQITSDSALVDGSENATPLRQAITTIEHKIRNLEKRKSKLESYKELQNNGKELNADQKSAVAKYDEVIHTLDFARDLCKQFLGIAVCSEKEAKKQAKREAAAKNQAELARLREILLVQDALNQMGNESVRNDFLHGRNGAAQLTQNDLKLLDELYPSVTPKHESGNPTAFMNEVQTAAEHLLAVVDGKPKEIYSGTYSQVKEILGKIHESGFFDQSPIEETAAAVEPETEVLYENPAGEVVESNELMAPQEEVAVVPDVVPVAQELVYAAIPQAHLTAQVPIRPITEMLGTGSFFFLQDSEIDAPAEQIPTQTFTNQQFGTAPPPPIPLPTHFQGVPLPQSIANRSAPPNNNGIEETQQYYKPDVSMEQKTNNHRSPARREYDRSYNNGYNNGNRPKNQNAHRNGPRLNNNTNRHNN